MKVAGGQTTAAVAACANPVRATVGLLVGCVLVAVGCGSGAPKPDDGVSPAEAVLICDGPIGVFDDLPDGYAAVGNVVAFPTVDALYLGRRDSSLDPPRSFAKFGLIVRSGSVFQIRAIDEGRDRPLMRWGTVGSPEPQSSLAVNACLALCVLEGQPDCPRGTTGEWAVYPGGVWTVEPACISLLVATADEIFEVRLPVGERCT